MNYHNKLLPIAIASLGVLGNAAAAGAVNFNFTYAPGTTFEQKVGFEMAGQIWSSYLQDDFTANIYIETTDSLAENVIGGALPGIEAGKQYHEYRKKVEQDVTSTIDSIAMNGLDSLSHKYDVFQAVYNGKLVKDMNRLNVTRANAKAIGLISDNSDLDGYILMSDLSNINANWNYDVLGNTVSDNSLDFLSVALHEVGHVMGFVSGVDNSNWLNIMTEHEANGDLIKRDRIKFFNPLDLYRFTEASAGMNAVDISIGGNSYFSIDGGITNSGNFATGQAISAGGDGYQASHWEKRDSDVLGIMDPVLGMGQKREITDLDLTAFDALGYDLSNSATLNWDSLYQTALTSATLASTEDLTEQVDKMIQDSSVYDTSDDEAYEWRGGWNQEAYFNQFSWQTVELDAVAAEEATSVPEPTTILGFLSLGLMGLRKLSRKK